MKTFTEEQLLKAMTKYNQNCFDKVEMFTELESLSTEENAKRQLEYIIELIEAQ